MANADNVGTLFSRMMRIRLRQDNPWLGMDLAIDRTQEIPEGHRTVRLPFNDQGVEAYNPASVNLDNQLGTTAAQMTRKTPHVGSTGYVDLTTNRLYEVNELVNLVAEQIVRPDLFEDAVREASFRVTESLNNEIRSTFAASTNDTVNVTASELGTANYPTTTAANFGNPAHQKLIYNCLDQMSLIVDYAFWANQGRAVVMSPAYYKAIRTYVINEKLYLVTGINDVAFTQGIIPDVLGWTVIKDNSMGQGTANTDDAKHYMYFVDGSRTGLSFARTVNRFALKDSEVYRGMLLQGDFLWGIAVTDPTRLRLVKTAIT